MQPLFSRVVRQIDSAAVRFIITGGSAACFFFALSFVAVTAGIPPFPVTILAYGTAFVAAYTAHQTWSFPGQRGHGQAFPRYLAVQIGCCLSSAILARILVADLGLAPLGMAAVTTLLSSTASYFLSRYWVFKA